jgi:hypothetical protein
VSDRRFTKGDVVAFDFTLDRPIAGRRGEKRSGVGVIANNDVDYQCWPPGYTVKVADSRDYKPGTYIAVCGHNLRRIVK